MEQVPVPQRPITGLAWWMCVLVAVAGLGAGGAATFLTDNGSGAVGLLAVGGVAGIIALLRRVPKISLAGDEIDPGTAYALGARHGAEQTTQAVADAVRQKGGPEQIVAAAKSVEERLRNGPPPS
ncbi:MAG: hypothetical protein ACRDQ1_13375 [Sciscionella sp.]